jgi:hypothetical protein
MIILMMLLLGLLYVIASAIKTGKIYTKNPFMTLRSEDPQAFKFALGFYIAGAVLVFACLVTRI